MSILGHSEWCYTSKGKKYGGNSLANTAGYAIAAFMGREQLKCERDHGNWLMEEIIQIIRQRN